MTVEQCYLCVCLVEQSGRHIVSHSHGCSSKESTRGSSALCEGGELV